MKAIGQSKKICKIINILTLIITYLRISKVKFLIVFLVHLTMSLYVIDSHNVIEKLRTKNEIVMLFSTFYYKSQYIIVNLKYLCITNNKNKSTIYT